MKQKDDIYIFRAKIDENLLKLHKRNLFTHHQVPSIGEDKQKLSKTNKWGVIKRQLKNQHQHFLNKCERQQPRRPQRPLHRDELLYIINRTLIMEHLIIRLKDTVAQYNRLPLLCIFMQCALAIIFNAYNLVVFLLKAAYSNGSQSSLKISMLLLFYGFHITTAFLDTLVTVVVHQCVHENIRRTGTIMDEMYLYISDDAISLKLTQFSSFVYNNLRDYTIYGLYSLDGSFIKSLLGVTATYIIILIQYSGDGEICKLPPGGNKTAG